jgi:DNA-binding CsgD family transcriptional regulator
MHTSQRIPDIHTQHYASQYNKITDIITKYSSKLQFEQRDVQPLIEHPQFDEFMKASPGTVCVMDFKMQSYMYMSENCIDTLGYPREDFLRLGLSKTITIFPKDQNQTIIEKVFPLMFSYFEKHAAIGDIKDIRISYNTKIQHQDGNILWLLHQMKVLYTDENNLPHFGMKLIVDITDIKKDEAIDFIVAKRNDKGRYEKIYSTTFISEDRKYNLSERECEVLQLIGDGHSSKIIADVLNISEHTVNSHRKNIMRKLDVKNGSEGLRKAISHGLI